jgi:hypothetical protein
MKVLESGTEAIMEQATKKRAFLPRRTGTIIAIVVIVLAAISVIASGPREAEHDSLFGADPTPTLVVSNLLSKATLHQSLTYQGVHVAFTQALLATTFSDDRKSVGNVGKYTVRIMMSTSNNNQSPVGVDYASLIHLILPNGDKISPKLSSVNAAELPGRPQSGFIDFPVSEKVDLATLKLQFENTVFPISS